MGYWGKSDYNKWGQLDDGGFRFSNKAILEKAPPKIYKQGVFENATWAGEKYEESVVTSFLGGGVDDEDILSGPVAAKKNNSTRIMPKVNELCKKIGYKYNHLID